MHKRKKKKRTRRKMFCRGVNGIWDTVSFRDVTKALGPDLFKAMCRMSITAFKLLLNEVRDLLTRPFKSGTAYRRSTVSAEVRLGFTLRMLAGGTISI